MGRKIYFCPLCKNQLRSNKRDECRQCGDITATDQPTVRATLTRIEPWTNVPVGVRQLHNQLPDLVTVIAVFANGDKITYEI